MDERTLCCCSQSILAPILMDFSLWLLGEAQKRGISTLYFLSRDGYALYRVAQYAGERFRYPIECRYLYCSRRSLHLPVYQFDEAGAFDHLFVESKRCTLSAILQRGGMTEEQTAAILEELQFDRNRIEKRLLTSEIVDLKAKAEKSDAFRAALLENSQAACQTTMAYLQQEGLLDRPTIALVDSGWSGTSQRAMEQLLTAQGYGGRVVGFYFGLYRDAPDGRASMDAWYFTEQRSFWNKVLFSPSLFECMVSAADGMTMGYACENGVCIPVKKNKLPEDQQRAKEKQLEAILDGCKCWKPHRWGALRARGRFRRLMAFPSKKEVDCYGVFLFSDDSAGASLVPLCGKEDVAAAKAFTWRNEWQCRLKGKCNLHNLYWVYGAVSLLPGGWERLWHRLNAITLEAYHWHQKKRGGKRK